MNTSKSKASHGSHPPVEGQIRINPLKPVRGLSRQEIERAVLLASAGRRLRGISIALVDDATLASLHERYLSDPRPTDVLSFDLRDDAANEEVEGEILVSVDAARREAARRRIPIGREVLRYIIHGTLHLLGYDDRTPARRLLMRREEDRVLRCLSGRASR